MQFNTYTMVEQFIGAKPTEVGNTSSITTRKEKGALYLLQKGGPLLTTKRGSSLFGIYHIPGCSCCVTAAGEVGAIPLIITGCGVEVG